MNNENINEIPVEETETVTEETTVVDEAVVEETAVVEEAVVETAVATVAEETAIAETTVVEETAKASAAPQKSGFAIASIVLGCVAFFFNPLYICAGLSVGFGAGGLISKKEPKNLYLIGMIIGIVAGLCQFAVDFLITLFTFGLGFFTFLL